MTQKKVIDLPVERIRAMTTEAVEKSKAADMKDEALNSRAFALMSVLSMKEQRIRRGLEPRPDGYIMYGEKR